MAESAVFDRLGSLLRYPDERLDAHLTEAYELLGVESPELAALLGQTRAAIGALGATAREELYTRTFDINPECTLEVGWQLFGEDYNRGVFLVRMRGWMRQVGVEERGELPDHLLHVLPVVARLPADEAEELVRTGVLPALDKMLEGFPDRSNPYRALLDTVRGFLTRRFGAAEADAPVIGQSSPYTCPATPQGPSVSD